MTSPRGQPAYAICRCGHWETDHDRQTGTCGRCPNKEHVYVFYAYRYALVSGEAPAAQADHAREIGLLLNKLVLAAFNHLGDETVDGLERQIKERVAALEAAEQQIVRLTQQNEKLLEEAATCMEFGSNHDLIAELVATREQIATLTEALKGLIPLCDNCDGTGEIVSGVECNSCGLARAALAAVRGEPK